MLALSSFEFSAPPDRLCAGSVLRERQQMPDCVMYLEEGRVLLGLYERGASGQWRHQLGMAEGPVWLDAATVLLGRMAPVDMVADTDVCVRRVAVGDFLDAYTALPEQAQGLLRDLAAGYLSQTELAISRLAQDAESRCAQWLLRHATAGEGGKLQVELQQRKRLIAAQLGIAPETFSRVLRQLREHGLIVGTGNVLSLPLPHALNTVAGG